MSCLTNRRCYEITMLNYKSGKFSQTNEINLHMLCTCCLKYLLSSSSTSTKFKKYLTENFLFTSLIVGVRS